MQATVVAFVRNKPQHFVEFLQECQRRVAAALGTAYRPYDVTDQIHATILGLERIIDPEGGYLNRSFYTHRDREAEMDFAGLLDYFRTCEHFPMSIQIGGFADRDYPFTSRGRRPFHRSFTIQPTRAKNGRTADNVVVMGWPVRGAPSAGLVTDVAMADWQDWEYPDTLDALRRGAQHYNVLHAYHRDPADVDNDFFFRIGMIDDADRTSQEAKQALVQSMREWLGEHSPVIVEVTLSDIYVVQYASDELPSDDGNTNAYPIDHPDVDGDFCRALYEGRTPSQ